MNYNPLVSVYIPTQNRHLSLLRAIQSVADQTYTNIEIVIVDDASETPVTLSNFSKKCPFPIKLLRNKTPKGACFSRNLAIKHSQGEYVTGLDDDDLFLPTRIELFVSKTFQLTSKGICFAALYDSSMVSVNGVTSKKCLWLSEVATFSDLQFKNIVGNQVFAKRTSYIEAGLFNIALPAWQDWDFWIRLSESGPLYSIMASSYILNRDHNTTRISRNIHNIRQAFYIFNQLHQPDTLSIRISRRIVLSRQIFKTNRALHYLIYSLLLSCVLKFIDILIKWGFLRK